MGKIDIKHKKIDEIEGEIREDYKKGEKWQIIQALLEAEDADEKTWELAFLCYTGGRCDESDRTLERLGRINDKLGQLAKLMKED